MKTAIFSVIAIAVLVGVIAKRDLPARKFEKILRGASEDVVKQIIRSAKDHLARQGCRTKVCANYTSVPDNSDSCFTDCVIWRNAVNIRTIRKGIPWEPENKTNYRREARTAVSYGGSIVKDFEEILRQEIPRKKYKKLMKKLRRRVEKHGEEEGVDVQCKMETCLEKNGSRIDLLYVKNDCMKDCVTYINMEAKGRGSTKPVWKVKHLNLLNQALIKTMHYKLRLPMLYRFKGNNEDNIDYDEDSDTLPKPN